jgi:hypothetical protein
VYGVVRASDTTRVAGAAVQARAYGQTCGTGATGDINSAGGGTTGTDGSYRLVMSLPVQPPFTACVRVTASRQGAAGLDTVSVVGGTLTMKVGELDSLRVDLTLP